ncbi:MAG: hypothetical protein BJ554DRAFT_7871 [Olpidium bornovanus]|uniref:Uncharacterized protein n=1 Tax=Olpidium bornovanus TaxID=278681 RepID=A0A8H8DMK7_9FUNG|nr:MAG: hypothetical protein BJ554DRAFT_7871 [Olpidium bornovanus]
MPSECLAFDGSPAGDADGSSPAAGLGAVSLEPGATRLSAGPRTSPLEHTHWRHARSPRRRDGGSAPPGLRNRHRRLQLHGRRPRAQRSERLGRRAGDSMERRRGAIQGRRAGKSPRRLRAPFLGDALKKIDRTTSKRGGAKKKKKKREGRGERRRPRGGAKRQSPKRRRRSGRRS